MWPQGTQGRGKAAHVEPSHLTNLILALGVADPITTAPQAVPEWRAMPARDSIGWMIPDHHAVDHLLRGCCFGEVSMAMDQYRDLLMPGLPKVKNESGSWSGKGDPRCYQVLPGKTLGSALDQFIQYLVGWEGERLADALQRVEWKLHLSSTKIARVTYWEDGITFSSHFHYPDVDIGQPGYVKSASFGFKVIEALAELWDNTLRFRISTPMSTIVASIRRDERQKMRERAKRQPLSPSDVPNSTPENETAAARPRQGTDAAALSDQPQNSELDGHSQSHSMDEREKSQSPSGLQADRSLHNRSNPHDDEPGDGGAYCAAA